MEYNTSLPHMIIPEYGRNIQKMIDYAITIKDREHRNKVAQSIIDVMGQLNPHLRDITDFKHKLWDHLFIISKFKLDVDSPYPMPTPATFATKPERIKIPGSQRIRYKHYGKITEDMVRKAAAFPNGEEKFFLAEIIGNLMKRSYLQWNRDTVTDNVILDQMEELSNAELRMENPNTLRSIADLLPKVPVVSNPQKLKPKNNNNRPHGGGNNNPNNKFKRKF